MYLTILWNRSGFYGCWCIGTAGKQQGFSSAGELDDLQSRRIIGRYHYCRRSTTGCSRQSTDNVQVCVWLYSWHTFQKSTPFFWRRFLLRVSCKSGTGFVWYQIPAPIRALLYSKPESGVHVTETIACDFFLIFNIHLSTKMSSKWSRFRPMAPVSGACVMGITHQQISLIGLENVLSLSPVHLCGIRDWYCCF